MFTEEQMESMLSDLGIDVVGGYDTNFTAYCPFHHNTNTPAFSVDKESGLWICFALGCEKSGSIETLVKELRGGNPYEVARFINQFKSDTLRFVEAMEKKEEEPLPEYPQYLVDSMKRNFWKEERGLEYMKSRGFSENTLDHFDIGYWPEADMVAVPAHDDMGNLVGVVRRSVAEKRFMNSKKFPKSRIVWNMNRAKRVGGTAIICESSFDAMKVHQAGYPNAVALLGGGGISHDYVRLINRYFSEILIFTDYEAKPEVKNNCKKCEGECVGHRPGREFGRKIVAAFPGKNVRWAAYNDECVYPHGAKDASDLTTQEIQQCVRNGVSNFEYVRWGIEDFVV